MARFASFRPALLATSVIALLLLVLSACSAPQNTFNPQTDAAQGIVNLYILVIVLACIVGVGVLGAIAFILIRFRARPGVPARQIHGSTRLEILWTVIPIIILTAVAVPTMLGIARIAQAAKPGALHVTAIGHQWWWEFQYEGLGPNGGTLTTANELWLPVDRQVSITLKSADVIHSFWVPGLVGKTDMVPNKVNQLETFTPTDVGIYDGQCNQFCGLAHAQMRMRVLVVTSGQFDSYIKSLQSPPPTPASGSPAAAGEALFMGAGTCFTCHTINGTNAKGAIGPDLSLLGDRTTLGAGIMPNTTQNLEGWISDPRNYKALPQPGQAVTMPSFHLSSSDYKLTDQQIADLAAYLESLKVQNLGGTSPFQLPVN